MVQELTHNGLGANTQWFRSKHTMVQELTHNGLGANTQWFRS